MRRVDTVIVGAGQAGLPVSYHLSQLGVEHCVLERGRIAESWRSGCWDSSRICTANRGSSLPGYPYSSDRNASKSKGFWRPKELPFSARPPSVCSCVLHRRLQPDYAQAT